jgi:hypothetical protein
MRRLLFNVVAALVVGGAWTFAQDRTPQMPLGPPTHIENVGRQTVFVPAVAECSPSRISSMGGPFQRRLHPIRSLRTAVGRPSQSPAASSAARSRR